MQYGKTLSLWFIFWNFLKRDIYLHWQHRYLYLVDNVLILPVISTLAFGYLQPLIFFGPGNETLGTTLFTGMISFDVFWIAFQFTMPFLLDLEQNRYIDYQLTLLPPHLIILERILAVAVATFVVLIPFLPIAKLLLGSMMDTKETSWIAVYLVLFFSALFCAAYHFLTMCLVKGSEQLGDLWMRFHNPLIYLGGSWVPLSAMTDYSPLLGNIALGNPILYMTEGIRSACMNSKEFLPVSYCILMLFLFSIACYIITCIRFKKRVDHI